MLCRKPGAIEHTRFFQHMPEQWRSYLAASQGKERRNALQLLEEMVKDGKSIFSGKIYCGECGEIYGSKVWHSNDPYRKVVWQCNGKYDGEKNAARRQSRKRI